MISNNISFTARIVRNDLLNAGFAQAKKDAYGGNSFYANSFVNSVSYLLNDGTDDVYEVVQSKPLQKNSSYFLLKNGQEVKSTAHFEKGRNVTELFNHYVQFDLNKVISSPRTKSMPQAVNMNDLNSLKKDLRNALKDNKKLSDEINARIESVSDYVYGNVADEVYQKLNKLDAII